MITISLALSGGPLSQVRVRVLPTNFHVIQPYEEAEPEYLELSASGLDPIPHYQSLRARQGQQT